MRSKPRMYVAIGTKNELKVNATQKVFQNVFHEYQIETFQVNVELPIPPQPIGLAQVVEGAKIRAQKAMEFLKNEASSSLSKSFSQDNNSSLELFGVGIEAGLVEIPYTRTGFLDFQFCVIIDKNNKMAIGSGPGWEYPPFVIEQILLKKEKEIFDIMKKLTGNNKIRSQQGAIGYFSKGLLTRLPMTEIALKAALIPFINKNSYF